MRLTPTAAPLLPADILVAGRAPVLVTGASGVLGRCVVEELLTSSIPVRALTHRRDVDLPEAAAGIPARLEHVTGDLGTGAGLDAALDGVEAVIHCAGNPKDARRVDVEGTRRLVDALDAWAPSAHLVHVSIVGCFENPYPYYRAKADAENVVEAWHGRASIVRATQFHPFVAQLVRGAGARALGAVEDIEMSPVDPRWVATKLVDVASLLTSLPTPMELAGPETFTLADIATLTAHLDRRRAPRTAPLPTIGATMRAFTRGAHLPSEQTQIGGRTYAQWLSAEEH